MPTLKPNGINQGDLVDVLHDILSSITGLCTKLDSDGTVTDTTYNANCYTNIFTVTVEDQKGNMVNPGGISIIRPTGISDPALLELLYQMYDSIETLTEQLDNDGGVPAETYEANTYEAILTGFMIENQIGNILGNSGTFWFRSGGVIIQDKLVDLLYNWYNAWETLCEQLDGDSLSDTDYEAVWWAATFTTNVTNSKGQTLGNG